MNKTLINPETVAKPIKPYYANAVKVGPGNLLFISGQVALDSKGNLVGKAQTRQVLENIKAILASVGADMENIVKVTVFLTDLRNFEAVAEVRAEYFRNNPPASTLVGVTALVSPDFLIEIEAIAVID
jgi:2-iminobutanoate/2-iminopropanoate deaminase